MSEDFEWLRIGVMLLMVGSICGIPVIVLWWDSRKARRAAEAPPADE